MATFWTAVCLLLSLFEVVRCDILCEKGFCAKYISEEGCTEPVGHCAANNETHSGLLMMSPTICNCCDFCLLFYMEDQQCSLGGPGNGFTVGRCNDGLECTPATDGNNYCRRMQSDCHSAQDLFDDRLSKGQTGAMEMRPECDGKGKYAPYSCVPAQTCFCQSEEGERIFGEVLFLGSITTNNMHCGCSRLHEKIKKSISSGVAFPVIGPQCTSDGNFNPIQCIDKNCYCVDIITGAIISGDGREINLDTDPISSLECYDESLDLFPEQNIGGPPYNYTTPPCFVEIQTKLELVQEKQKAGYIVDYFNSFQECLPDWTYGRVSKKQTGEKVCVDERNQVVGHYSAKPDTPEYETMDCKCASTSLVMAAATEKPVCCKNGNFRKIQCHRGMCRCVDSDGRQTSEQENADVTKLSCHTSNWRFC